VFSDLAESLDIPKSSLHALLSTLVQRSWIRLDQKARRYRIAVRAWETGQAYLPVLDLVTVAEPHLRSAQVELGETVQLGVLEGVEVLYVAKVDSDRPIQLASKVGARLPAWATGLGKVLLASLPPEDLRRRMADIELTPFTESTRRNLSELEVDLAQIRTDWVGCDDGEYSPFIHCVSVPVRNGSGNIIAAMSCSVPERLGRGGTRRLQLAAILRKHASALSRDLGMK
jgi:DNA-binding IclR family transcriptional regulator